MLLGENRHPDSGDLMELLVNEAAKPWFASALIVAGIIAGTAGNFLTL